MTESDDTTAPDNREKKRRGGSFLQRWGKLAPLVVAVGLLGIWIATRSEWITAQVFTDHAGESQQSLKGGDWLSGAGAISLAIAAVVVAGFLVRGWLHRLLGVLTAVLGAVIAVPALTTLFGNVDSSRVRELLVEAGSGAGAGGAVNAGPSAQETGGTVEAWSQVTETSVNSLPVAVTVLAAVIVMIGGVIAVISPRKAKNDASYETPKVRREAAMEKAPEDRSSKELWDALDAGDDDPTGPAH